ncbi:MAG TPA: hypothetical protein VGN04_17335 [Herbaspirillum sp.]|jgi:hypothetical protein
MNKKITLIFLKNGNLKIQYQFILGFLGIFLLLLPAFFTMSHDKKMACLSLGALIGAIGGYSAKASVLGIKPFDNSYKKAKASYDDNEEDTKK